MTENRSIQNIIITDRLILEKINPDDYDFLISLLNSKVTKLGFRFEKEMELETKKLHVYTN